MGRLKDVRCYLCGPVENSDSPITWRDEITNPLRQIGLIIYDPLRKPKWMPPVDGKAQKDMRTNLGSPETRLKNHAARTFCMNIVRHCNIIILKMDYTFTVGTFEEIAIASGKPIFVISKEITSMWLIDQLNLYDGPRRDLYWCPTTIDCLNKMRKIDQGLIDVDPFEWVFLDNFYSHKGENNV